MLQLPGAGKTIQSLMLVMCNPPPPDWAVEDPTKVVLQHDPDDEEIFLPVPVQTTMIVMPSNLLGQWQEEVKLHTHDNAISWSACISRVLPYAALCWPMQSYCCMSLCLKGMRIVQCRGHEIGCRSSEHLSACSSDTCLP